MPRKLKQNNVTPNDVPSTPTTKVLSIQQIAEIDERFRFAVAEQYDKHGCLEKCKYIMQDSGMTMKRTKLIGLNSAYDTCALIFRQKTSKYENETKWIVNQLTRIGDNLLVNATAYSRDFAGNKVSNAFVFGKIDKPTFQKHYNGFDSTTGAIIDGGFELNGFNTEFYLKCNKDQVLELSKCFDEDGKTSLIINTGNRKYSVDSLSDFYHESFSELRQALQPKAKSVFDTNNTSQSGASQ